MKNLTPFSLEFIHQRSLCFAIALLCLCQMICAQNSTVQPTRPLGEIDIVRIQELHHITDTFGDQIWPAFDTRKIPVAINNDDKQELLIGHPNPSKEYHPFEKYEVNSRPVMVRDGVSRYGPRGGGWAVEISGAHSAYVSTLNKDQDTESYLSLILHECFHCFQKNYRQGAKGAHGDLPEDDPVYSALIGLESRVLKTTLEESNDEKARELARMFVAVRHERRKDMPKNLILREGEDEFNEGTATYSQARLYQLLAKKGGITPAHPGKDPQYNGFLNAKKDYQTMISRIIPPKGQPIGFFHAMYNLGMAQCLVLDRVRPKWKEQMRERGMTQFALLEKEFPMQEDTEKEQLAKAKEQFDYDDLLDEQKKLVDERLNLIRRYIDAPGRHYRIYHNRIPVGFKWKPFGPVYHIPESLEKELADKKLNRGEEKIHSSRLIWAGGIRRFEKEGLLFESEDTPMIFGQEYMEWIDPDPAADPSDMTIEFENHEVDTYVGVKIRTDGFILEADKARIDWSTDVVRIYPIPH